jgi:hypothetical protein
MFIVQILYVGTVGDETISGMYILRVSDCCLTPIQQEENRRCTIQKKRLLTVDMYNQT